MLYFVQILTVLSVAAVSLLVLMDFLRIFQVSRRVYLITAYPILLFSIGFSLRLTGDAGLVDIGFFLTDFSSLTIWIIFALTFVLGQLKYWSIKK